jgi:hypothetical protein
VTDTRDELLLLPAQSPLGPFYRWLAFASGLVLAGSMFLGFLGFVLHPFGALGALVSLLAGMRWLDRQPRLRAVRTRDFLLLLLAVAATFAASRALLLTPDVYPIYWAGLALLALNAIVFVRHRARGVWICSAVFLVFFVLVLVSVRSQGLIRAVQTGSPGHARLFLWSGADANLRNQHDPLLVIALRSGDSTTVRLLLDHGADPNARTSAFMSRTPALSEAVAMGRTEFVELLLDRGAAPNLPNDWGETALGRAARTGQVRAAKLLLSRGANPNHADRYGRRPIDSARAKHDSDMERILAP